MAYEVPILPERRNCASVLANWKLGDQIPEALYRHHREIICFLPWYLKELRHRLGSSHQEDQVSP